MITVGEEGADFRGLWKTSMVKNSWICFPLSDNSQALNSFNEFLWLDHSSEEWKAGNCKMKRQALIVWAADCWAGATSGGLEPKQKWQKKYNRFLCTFSGMLDSGPDTSSERKTGTKHGCLCRDESLAVLHTGEGRAWKHQGFFTKLHLSCPFFLRRRKSIKLGALDLHPEGCKLARMAFRLWQHAMLPWKELHWEWKAEVSGNIDKGGCEKRFHYVPQVKTALLEFCWYPLWAIINWILIGSVCVSVYVMGLTSPYK